MHYLDDESSPGTALPNILPYVELFLFILLALLAGAAGTNDHEFIVQLARVQSASPSERPSVLLKVTVTAAGEYRVWGKPVDAAGMRSRVASLKPGATVVIEADGDAKNKDIAVVKSAAYKAGLRCAEKVIHEEQP
jgi:biopolymer transport protein ExbD